MAPEMMALESRARGARGRRWVGNVGGAGYSSQTDADVSRETEDPDESRNGMNIRNEHTRGTALQRRLGPGRGRGRGLMNGGDKEECWGQDGKNDGRRREERADETSSENEM